MIEWRPAAVRSITGHSEVPLREWQCRKEPASVGREIPAWIQREEGWREAEVPGREPDAEAAPTACDHWYRCSFAAEPGGDGRQVLSFEGLTPADVWLNGNHLFRTDNMFHGHVHDVTRLLGSLNELVIRFHSLHPILHHRRPRGRWPTRLVSHKNLRFLRTTLIGHMPGWCPIEPHIGPWRPIHLLHQRSLAVTSARLSTGWTHDTGQFSIDLQFRVFQPVRPTAARLLLNGRLSRPLACLAGEGADHWRIEGEGLLSEISPWWPHTHGTPRLYAAAVEVTLGAEVVHIELDPIGFRTIARTGSPDDFQLECNGVPIFCRGACWVPLDLARLHATESQYQSALEQVRDAGMNMVRISGTMAYESDDFFRTCDRLGIMVWQDFMFANMDYPVQDPDFMRSCTVEARQQVERVRARPSLAVLCGNSEVGQQAAMMGLSAQAWSNSLFDEVLPGLCQEGGANVPYVPSSPWGKTLPFHLDRGPSHYYGVGAYRRPIADVHAARVRFASECLAFSNPPATREVRALLGNAGLAIHHPRYKAGVPRDPGAAWDFADVTEHYVEDLFGSDVRRIRASDPERYLALCRVAVGTVASRTIGIWRRPGDPCAGALVWLLRDVAPGAGWGIIGHDGKPKSLYHYLKRACASTAVWLVDQGLSGATVHAANDSASWVRGDLHLNLYRADGKVVANHVAQVELAPRQGASWPVEHLLGTFVDSSYAYRFGPPGHEMIAVRFDPTAEFTADRAALRAFLRPGGPSSNLRHDIELVAHAEPLPAGFYRITLRANRPAQAVTLDCPEYQASDDYFDLEPNVPYTLTLRPLPGARPPIGRVQSLEMPTPVAIEVQGGPAK